MTPFEKWSIWVSSALVTLTGVVFLLMKYALPAPTGFSVLRHPLQPLVLTLHILTAPLFLLALGAILLRHVWRHIITRTRQGKMSGWSAALMAGPMIVTGYVLQVLSSERWLQIVALIHIVAGAAFAVGLLIHQVVAQRGRRAVSELIAKGDRRHKPPRRTSSRRAPS